MYKLNTMTHVLQPPPHSVIVLKAQSKPLTQSLFFSHCLCSRDRCGDSEGESLAMSPQPGFGVASWHPDRPEDSDNQRNVKRTGQTSIQLPPVTVTSPPGEINLIQCEYHLRPTACRITMPGITFSFFIANHSKTKYSMMITRLLL